jgi:hypothetical protein
MNRLQSVYSFFVLFLKGDLAIAAGFGTLLTVYDFSRTGEVVDDLWVSILSVLIAAGVTLFLLSFVVVEMAKPVRSRSISNLGWLVMLVTLVHAGAYGFCFSGMDRFIDRRAALARADEASEYAGSAVEEWTNNRGKLPPPDSLFSSRSGENLRRWLERGQPDTLHYRILDSLSYEIILPGPDGEMGTADDIRSIGVVVEE